jgi:5,10-methylenetetrahydromethanopterin reductase
MKVSFCILPDDSVEDILDTIELGDRLGFDAVYLADEIFHQDAWQLLACGASRTQHIELVITTNIVLNEPSYVAQRLLTLDALSNGRAAALYSIGNPSMLKQHGVDMAGLKAIGRLREAHQIMRTVLDTGKVDFAGKLYNYEGIFTSARPRQPRIPLTMGGMRGPKTLELAGEVADGLMTGLTYSEEALRYAADCMKRGAERAGRDWRSLEFGAGVIGAISPDGDAARAVSRVIAAFYIPALADEAAVRHGIDPEELAPVRAAFGRGDTKEAVRLAPDHVTDKLMMPVGTPTEWLEQLSVLGPLGYNHVSLTPVDNAMLRTLVDFELPQVPTFQEQLQLIHDEVLPALRSMDTTSGSHRMTSTEEQA